ncbi:MAG: hypothetical protein ACKOPO_14085, partial [Novosphingobium sp.]
MKQTIVLPVLVAVASLAAASFAAASFAAGSAHARPVFVAETPGHTRFSIDDASIVELTIGGARVRQARILTQNVPDPALVSGQIAADGVMQFNCAAQSYREWSTVAIRKDGTRQEVVSPLATRGFNQTRDG